MFGFFVGSSSPLLFTQKLHGVVRPQSLKTDVIKKRYEPFLYNQTVYFNSRHIGIGPTARPIVRQLEKGPYPLKFPLRPGLDRQRLLEPPPVLLAQDSPLERALETA